VSSEGALLPKGMEYYAERYRVGVVQIRMSDSEIKVLKDSPTKTLDYIDKVFELIPAAYDPVPLKEKRD
jgi:hypothetical protein